MSDETGKVEVELFTPQQINDLYAGIRANCESAMHQFEQLCGGRHKDQGRASMFYFMASRKMEEFMHRVSDTCSLVGAEYYVATGTPVPGAEPKKD